GFQCGPVASACDASVCCFVNTTHVTTYLSVWHETRRLHLVHVCVKESMRATIIHQSSKESKRRRSMARRSTGVPIQRFSVETGDRDRENGNTQANVTVW